MNYIFNERKRFATLGELRKITQSLSDDTVLTICGSSTPGFFHIREDRKLVTLDYDALDDCYDVDEEDYETEGADYMDY